MHRRTDCRWIRYRASAVYDFSRQWWRHCHPCACLIACVYVAIYCSHLLVHCKHQAPKMTSLCAPKMTSLCAPKTTYLFAPKITYFLSTKNDIFSGTKNDISLCTKNDIFSGTKNDISLCTKNDISLCIKNDISLCTKNDTFWWTKNDISLCSGTRGSDTKGIPSSRALWVCKFPSLLCILCQIMEYMYVQYIRTFTNLHTSTHAYIRAFTQTQTPVEASRIYTCHVQHTNTHTYIRTASTTHAHKYNTYKYLYMYAHREISGSTFTAASQRAALMPLLRQTTKMSFRGKLYS